LILSTKHPILIADQWVPSAGGEAFQAFNPNTGEALPDQFPVSTWSDCELILEQAARAFDQLRQTPSEILAIFCERYAELLEQHGDELAALAHLETALPVAPRLRNVELPRTINQLKHAAAAIRDESWRLATIDTQLGLRSELAAVGPVVTIGPNNFPFAFNGAAGGDFVAAIAAGNPVIVKAHPSHPGTTLRLTQLALSASQSAGLPIGSIQMLYRLSKSDGLRLVSDRRVAATGFTGGRSSGLALKQACDAAGKLIYLEMSSINPVVLLPGAIAERPQDLQNEFCTSCLMGAGQFCTNPGFVLMVDSPAAQQIVTAIAGQFSQAPAGALLSAGGLQALANSVQQLRNHGAKCLAGGEPAVGQPGFRFQNTLLTITGSQFLSSPEVFQTEMFGAASLVVLAQDLAQLIAILGQLEGNLTGTIYAAKDGSDDDVFRQVATALRPKVGRLIQDKMPTGVAVSAAMNHGGPYPSTGHPGFTAVGIPASLRRFAALHCYDQVRDDRLPVTLRNQNPNGRMWRCIDGQWTQHNVPNSAT
jgi:NADP-dependent aldehyde dehydrogenase